MAEFTSYQDQSRLFAARRRLPNTCCFAGAANCLLTAGQPTGQMGRPMRGRPALFEAAAALSAGPLLNDSRSVACFAPVGVLVLAHQRAGHRRVLD